MKYKSFFDTAAWRWIKTILEILLIAAVIWGAVALYTSFGFGEAKADDFCETMYILCDDYVNVRMTPNKKQEPIGRLETGDAVLTDGRRKNGYIHVVDLNFECCEGWVNEGFLIYDMPEKMNRKATIISNGRLAARKYVNGKRKRWLQPQATVRVYCWSDSWCVTDCGYVQSRYLELDGD